MCARPATTMEGGYTDGRVGELPKNKSVFPREDYVAESDADNYTVLP